MPVPTHKKSGGQDVQAFGRSRGGFSTKIHIAADGLGNLLRLRLTSGQAHDSKQAPHLLQGLMSNQVMADRGYAAQALIDEIIKSGAIAVIPPHARAKTKRDDDRWVYRERHLVECFIGKIKQFRRVFLRFDKLARRYASFVHFASAVIWLR
jgi:transposase